MHRQLTVRIDGTVSSEAHAAQKKRAGGRIREARRCLIDLTGCDSAAGVGMFFVDVLLLVVVCAIQGFVVAHHNQIVQIERSAEAKCNVAYHNLERMKDKTRLLTQSKVAFFDANGFSVTRSAFRTFADGRHFDDAVLQAIEFIPEVLSEAERTVLEIEGSAYGAKANVQAKFPGWKYTFHQTVDGVRHSQSPSPGTPYYPVHYVEPLEGNEGAFGFNLASSAKRLEAITRAKTVGQPVASSRITLVQSVTPGFGYLYFEPMFNALAAFQGLVLAVFKCDEMLAAAVKDYDLSGIFILLFDVTESEDYLAHYFQGEEASERFDAYKGATISEAVANLDLIVSLRYNLSVGYRSWQLVCGSGDAYYQQEKTDIETFTFFSLMGMDYTTTVALMIMALILKRNADRAVERMKVVTQRMRTRKRLAQLMEFDDIKAELKAMYESLDVDGDGKLTAEEWSEGLASNQKLISRYFGDTTAEDHMAVFELLDTDGSGALSWDEFVTGAEQFAKEDRSGISAEESSGTSSRRVAPAT